MIVLGFDTSNYTTSAAWFDGTGGENSGRLLSVKSGELGLRQSDALFQHVKRLPEILEALPMPETPSAVAASTRPRAVEGSYMPCFLAGQSQAQVLAHTLGIPFYEVSHQQGHLAAVLWSAGRMELLEGEFLAWHLSGGTTELLHVTPGLKTEIIGGTRDLSAGQLIDRTGQLLQLDFPAGKALDALAADVTVKPFPVKVQDMYFSLSGMQNQVQDRLAKDTPKEEIAAFSLTSCAYAVKKATQQAKKQYGELPVVFTGGVSSNSQLRKAMIPEGGLFGLPRFSTDNAMGVAVLCFLAENHQWTN
ncbi:MAG: DNA-binding protein [Oscillospiraceae bacterium]|nr:DNA-binding protein [Oscillospiraceae bacterium]